MSIPHRRRSLFALTVVAVVAAGLMARAQAPQQVGTWAPAGAVSGVASGAASVALLDGRTLILGGFDGTGAATGSVIVYNPVAHALSAAGQLLAARVGHTATLLADGRVLVAGGTANGALSADLEIFDPALGTSALAGLMAQARSGHAAARLPDGSVLIVGGATANAVATANGEVFDPSSGGTSILPYNLAQPRTGASATTLIDGRVLVAGGRNPSGDLGTAEIFEAYSQTFTLADTQLSAARSGHTAVLLPHNNSVLIAGGSAAGQAVNVVDLFLPAQFPDPYSYGIGTFAASAPMAAPRSGAASGPGHADGYAVVAGGGSVDAERYRFATIKTDKDDYAPGERAVITGSGWQPGEVVTLLFQEDPAVHEDYVLQVTADVAGSLYWDRWAPEQHDLNVRFYLLASGSRSKAQMTFTDGNIGEDAITIGEQSPNPVTPGGAVTFEVTVKITGNSQLCTATLSAAPSGATPLPAATTFAFTLNGLPNNTVSGSGPNTEVTRTLTIQTPTGIDPNTAYDFTVAAAQNACQNSNTRIRTGIVVVGASPNTAPVAAAQSISTNEDNAATISLSGSDADGNALTFEIVTSPGNGTLGSIGSVTCSSTTPSNCSAPVVYTPNLNFNGSDSFTFRVKDVTTFSAAATVSITVNAVNDPPSFTSGGNVAVNEDSAAYSSGWASGISVGPANESGQTVSFNVSNDNNALFSVQPALAPDGTLTFTPAANAFGSATVSVSAQDNGGTANGGSDTSATQTFTITINPVNDAPSITGLTVSPAVISENDSVTVSGTFADPDIGDSHTVQISWGDGTASLTAAVPGSLPGTFSFLASRQYLDDDPTATSSDNYTVTVLVTDNGASTPSADNLSAADYRIIQVNNVLSVIGALSGPLDPIQLGGLATVGATFTDVGTADTHTCTINWDDGTPSAGTVTEASGAGSCSASKLYATAGVYTVKVTITDDDTGSASQYFQYVVIYDPSAGFVTGGGWIDSPAGAYVADPSLEGKANFGFVSKYAKGAKVPTGETEFQFKAGNVNFHSLSYDWLVVAGAKAQYKGLGKINGALAPNGTAYKFLLTATDGQVNGGGGQDKLRLKIWYESGAAVYLVYDNAPGADDIDQSSTQELAGGSIVVHSK